MTKLLLSQLGIIGPYLTREWLNTATPKEPYQSWPEAYDITEACRILKNRRGFYNTRVSFPLYGDKIVGENFRGFCRDRNGILSVRTGSLLQDHAAEQVWDENGKLVKDRSPHPIHEDIFVSDDAKPGVAMISRANACGWTARFSLGELVRTPRGTEGMVVSIEHTSEPTIYFVDTGVSGTSHSWTEDELLEANKEQPAKPGFQFYFSLFLLFAIAMASGIAIGWLLSDIHPPVIK